MVIDSSSSVGRRQLNPPSSQRVINWSLTQGQDNQHARGCRNKEIMSHYKLLISYLLFVFIFSNAMSAASENSEAKEPTTQLHALWDRVVCIQTLESPQTKTGRLCSAFLVTKANRLFLVTAGHAASETKGESRVLYLDTQSESQWVTLSSLVPHSTNPWQRDQVSDLAIAELIERKGNKIYMDHLRQLAFDADRLTSSSPGRLTPITCIGFPLGVGMVPKVSPLAIPGHIVSDELPAKNDWGTEPILFASPALAQGTSGGPAITVDVNANCTGIVGMYIGVLSDQTGGKLSKLVPAKIIKDAIGKALN